MSDINKAFAARSQLVVNYPTVIKAASLRLTDTGFQIDIEWDKNASWSPPKEFMGFPVNAFAV
jgi:hypothetical protein